LLPFAANYKLENNFKNLINEKNTLILVGVAIGGAIGSVLRYLIQIQSLQWLGDSFPYGTLLVNVVGSLLIGFLSFLFLERIAVSEEVRFAILVGVLGGFTTFSTFSLETFNFIQQGDYLVAIGNVFLSVSLCLLACFLGISLARLV
jgi:CrcB protein